MAIRKLSDQIVEDFLSRIGKGQLVEGSIIPSEMALCALYNVTRGVVREAIRSLDAKGFVKVSQGVGTIVTPSHEWNILDPVWVAVNCDSSYFDALHVTREFLEPEIAALAAVNATSQNITELKRLLIAQEQCNGDALEHAKKDIQWHAALARATQNPILNQMHNSISNMGIKTRIETARLPESIQHANRWHSEIINAVITKNPELARAAMRMHLNQVREDLDKALKAILGREVYGNGILNQTAFNGRK